VQRTGQFVDKGAGGEVESQDPTAASIARSTNFISELTRSSILGGKDVNDKGEEFDLWHTTGV